MSTTTDTHTATPTDTCPSWCVEHIEPDDVHDGVQWGGDTPQHNGPDVTGESLERPWIVGIGQDGTEPATVDAWMNGQLTPAQARAFAAAIVQACDMLEGAPATSTANIARRVAERIRSAGVDAGQVAALSATLGMTLEEVLGLDPA